MYKLTINGEVHEYQEHTTFLEITKEFQKEYEKLRPRYEVISKLIELRKEQNITQAELARRVGTQKSNISRLESGNYNPSLDFLIKVVHSLGKELEIQIR